MSKISSDNNENATPAPAVVVADQANVGNTATPVPAADPEDDDLDVFIGRDDLDSERRLEPEEASRPPTPDPIPIRRGRDRNIWPTMVPATAPSNVVVLPDVEVWPEPVNGADVLTGIAQTFSRYVALPEGAADVLALWAAHTHCFESFQCTPRLNISSPEKGCGKTTVRDLTALFVQRPLPVEQMSEAVIYHLIGENLPTLLIDEYDAWLLRNEKLRGLLNSGHRSGGQVLRCGGSSVRRFPVFAPVMLCGIGELPVTLLDRSIIIPLARARPGEIHARFDSRRVTQETELCRKAARFCADNRARIEACDPVLPASATNRLGDNWRPLFIIAEVAGGDWPGRVANAYAKLAVHDTDEQGIGTMLLADIQQVFATRRANKLFTVSLIEALCAMPERPWLEAHKGRRIDANWLARSLRNYRIKPNTIRIGRTLQKGYRAADFRDAFERYVPQLGLPSRNTVTRAEYIADYQI